MSDAAPTLFTEDGTPVKPRIIGATCEGDLTGEGHYGYRDPDGDAGDVTLVFEEAPDE